MAVLVLVPWLWGVQQMGGGIVVGQLLLLLNCSASTHPPACLPVAPRPLVWPFMPDPSPTAHTPMVQVMLVVTITAGFNIVR